jgi:hypothetical protein
MKEIWKDIKKHPDYRASSLGRIRRVSTGKIIKNIYLKSGFSIINLPDKNNKRGMGTFYIHHLIAETFLGKRSRNRVVIHRNGKNKDNRACNLMYGTFKQLHRLYYNRNKKWITSKLTSDAVFDIKKRLCKGEKPEDIAERYDIAICTVTEIRCNQTWTYVPWPKMKKNFYYKPRPSRKGEGSYVHKLSNKDVIRIRKLLAQGVKGTVLAERYNIDNGMISRIKHRKAWYSR